ncbi:MAG TPA: alpha/beta fold hydrolase [Solirubrobacteraceae bacterium]|jgi:pimeloyl-ACP methyl ester carboxylesterase|nr:alpha/beta fold hydrolase [Solirubrobacteraceae bacterium]
MRPLAGKPATALLAAILAGLLAAATTLATSAVLAAPASATIAFAPCAGSNNFACGHLTVPLDPSGATPGAITLAVRRHLAPVGDAKSAVIALAGGPGQAAIPFAEDFTELLGPILATRDLIVYDQRGTGLSHPLSCHGFEHPGSYHSFSALIAACAGQIGAERAFYTTPDTVADIEAIRQAGGYEKLVLYGTSYGTKVALEYAQEHPEHVEALILDSVVPPNGPEPLGRPTLAAVPRILRQLCAFHACAQITPNPVRDLARLVQRLRRGPLRGRAIDGHGHAHTVPISSNDLLEMLIAGDLDPILRAEFIAAVRGAADGDSALLARLLARAQGGENESGEDVDVPLYYATTCEEQQFPWSRTVSPSARLAQGRAQLAALPASSLAPFTAVNAFAISDMPACAFWPFATPAPPVVSAPLPNVPTLILSGADDLRTPTSGARAVAAQVPDAHLLVVPNTGHSVLGTEVTSCARNALRAQFAGKRIVPCPNAPPPAILAPTPLAPARLADVPPAHGYRARAGRTLQAVKLTLADFAHQLLLAVLEKLAASHSPSISSLSTGGLRAGWVQTVGTALRFHDYSYVPGVSITGTVKSESVALRIGGAAAAHGTLRLGAHRALVGVLGDEHVRLAASAGATAGAGASAANAARVQATGAMRAPLARLEDELDRLPAGLGADLSALPALWATRLHAGL